MTATTNPVVKDKHLEPCGLVESASVNSITDFVSTKMEEKEVGLEVKKEDFLNAFICHLIFYIVFCVSLALYILIDLGLGSFIKNKLVQMIDSRQKNIFRKVPAFA